MKFYFSKWSGTWKWQENGAENYWEGNEIVKNINNYSNMKFVKGEKNLHNDFVLQWQHTIIYMLNLWILHYSPYLKHW